VNSWSARVLACRLGRLAKGLPSVYEGFTGFRAMGTVFRETRKTARETRALLNPFARSD
jgi:hypothetical protein